VRAILGIDAAWTSNHPSGVALLRETDGGEFECGAAESSYGAFMARAGLDDRLSHEPDPASLLEAARRLAKGTEVAVVAVDIPVAVDQAGHPVRITRRRMADNEISTQFGRYKCSTHSPSEDRPGRIGVLIGGGFQLPLAVNDGKRPVPCLMEVYPHTAALRLLQAPERIPYKVSKARNYWAKEKLAPPERRRRIAQEMDRILAALKREIHGIVASIPAEPFRAGDLKATEDTIDALLSAWVGVKYLRGEAEAYGDESAAIWVPCMDAEFQGAAGRGQMDASDASF
jgi:predicted RNase H-like nuclease